MPNQIYILKNQGKGLVANAQVEKIEDTTQESGDDVIEAANFASLPLTGESGKIYVTTNDNKIYRWSGSVYVQIGGGKIDKTYSELQTLITTSGLVKGQVYRLTDYMTTYTQPVTGVAKSTGIVEALYITATDVNKLHNVCKSELYPQDIVYYDINDNTEGFTKGKIFRRIDTIRNNDIGTDWRHVKYDRDGVDKLLFDEYSNCYNNEIKTYTLMDSVVGSSFYSNTIGDYFVSNTISDYFNGNTIGSSFNSNTIGSNFYSNTIGSNFSSNNIGYRFTNNNISDYFVSNTISDYFVSNTISDYFNGNTIGNVFNSNTIESYFYYNTIGNEFYSNTIGSNFYSNTIGSNFSSNNIGYRFTNNTIGDYFNNQTISNNTSNKVFWNTNDVTVKSLTVLNKPQIQDFNTYTSLPVTTEQILSTIKIPAGFLSNEDLVELITNVKSFTGRIDILVNSTNSPVGAKVIYTNLTYKENVQISLKMFLKNGVINIITNEVSTDNGYLINGSFVFNSQTTNYVIFRNDGAIETIINYSILKKIN